MAALRQAEELGRFPVFFEMCRGDEPSSSLAFLRPAMKVHMHVSEFSFSDENDSSCNKCLKYYKFKSIRVRSLIIPI